MINVLTNHGSGIFGYEFDNLPVDSALIFGDKRPDKTKTIENTDTKRIYVDMLQPILELLPNDKINDYAKRIPFLILILISSMNETLLFSDQKFASLLELTDDNFADQLSQCLTGIVMNPST